MTTPVQQRHYYPGLDSLRALAAISVLATHTSFWSGQYVNGFFGAMTARFDIGVAFFFVLSGFLLSVPFLGAIAQEKPAPSTGRYFWKRGLRIVPLAVIVTVVALTLLTENRQLGIWSWAQALTLSTIYVDGVLPAGLTHMWSLATEVAFYLLLPVFMATLSRLVCRRRWNPLRIMVVVLALSAVTVVWLAVIAPHRPGAGQWLPGYFTWFGVGIALAVVVVDLRMPGRSDAWPRMRALAAQPGACWVMAIALFAVVTTPAGGPTLLIAATHTETITKNLLYAVIAGLIVLPSVLGIETTRYATRLAHPALRHIGHISYGIFCIHLLVIHALAYAFDYQMFTGRGWELFTATLLISLVLAEIAYRVIERPAMRLKDFGRADAKAAPTAAPSAASTTH